MDIAITLPESLWKKIVSGEKTIELRKNFPKDFNVITDRVYVLLKGTTQIAGYFVVRSFEKFIVPCMGDFEPILPKIAVQRQWVIDYIGNSHAVYLWHIRFCNPFAQPVNRKSIWDIKNNPQSYIYIR